MAASKKDLPGGIPRNNILLMLVATFLVILVAQRYILGPSRPYTPQPVNLNLRTGGAAAQGLQLPRDMPFSKLDSSYQRVITKSLPETLSQLLQSSRVVTILGCTDLWLRSAQVPDISAKVLCVDADCDLLADEAARHRQQGRVWHYHCLSPQVTGRAPPNFSVPRGIQHSAPQLVADSLVIMNDRKKPGAASVLEAAAMMDRPRLQTVVAETAAGNLTHLLVRPATSQRHTLFEPSHNKYMAAFAKVYADKFWGDHGNGSGTGSNVNYTRALRRDLVSLLKDLGVNSMLDSSCGGMAWMPLVIEEVRRFNPNFRYLGMDVACPVVEKHQKTFQANSSYMSFACGDASHEAMPQGYDLIFSRDSLQHLPIREAYAFLHNVVQSKAKYLLVGSYLHLKSNENVNVATEGVIYYSINLLASPFRVGPAPLRIINETEGPPNEPLKSMLLLPVGQLHWTESLQWW